MARWNLVVTLDADSGTPLYRQLARALIDAITEGRLAAGSRMPGSRTLARSLALHRNTVNAAYDELTAEGWIEARSRSGTYVCRSLPATDPVALEPFAERPAPRSKTATRYRLRRPPLAWRAASLPPGSVDLVGGRPDLSLIPVAALTRAYARSVRRMRAGALGYGDPRGHVRFREAIAQMLASARGMAVRSDNILITSGSQMALYLVARTLLGPGDSVAVEALGYPSAWAALRASGARLIPVELDEQGLRTEDLDRVARRNAIRAVYVTPHHQYPTTVPLSSERRAALIQLARRHRFAILEDDYDHEIHYDGRPLAPLAASDRLESVVYLGSLSKIFAPGLRLGFVAAPPSVIQALAAHRSVIDLTGNAGIELAAAELLEDGEVQRHLRRVTRIYRQRRDALVRELAANFDGAVAFTVPHGGTAVWCRTRGSSPAAWVARCHRAGVYFQEGSRFALSGRQVKAVRVGFTRASEAEIQRGVHTMAELYR